MFSSEASKYSLVLWFSFSSLAVMAYLGIRTSYHRCCKKHQIISNNSLIYIRLSALNCDYWVVYVSGFLHDHKFRVLGTSTAAINTLYIRMVFSNLILYYSTLSSLAPRSMPYNYSDFQT